MTTIIILASGIILVAAFTAYVEHMSQKERTSQKTPATEPFHEPYSIFYLVHNQTQIIPTISLVKIVPFGHTSEYLLTTAKGNKEVTYKINQKTLGQILRNPTLHITPEGFILPLYAIHEMHALPDDQGLHIKTATHDLTLSGEESKKLYAKLRQVIGHPTG
jgi:hypothetical protein